jgi:hypothetical protein
VHGARERRGVSRLAVPVALIVVLAVAGGYVFLTRSPAVSTSTQSSISSTQPSIPLRSAVDQFLQDFNAREVDSVLTFYTPTSVVVWSGKTGGLVGKYTGASNIRLIYAASVGKTSTMDANLSDYAQNVFSPKHINATFMVVLLANSSVAGKLNATVDVSQEWNWGSGGWHISKENWDYTYFDASLLDLQYGSATTFPQWGYMQEGGNPNLVSEKSFEWHAGPFLAAGLYGFLFSILTVMALRFRSRDKRGRPA